MSVPDEFETIEKLLRPLAAGASEAFGLLDDAAAIPSRPGFDLIITKDALVEGVHFLSDDPLDLVARKLLRVNLSDLAAKGAVPYGYFLSCAWPQHIDWDGRKAFAAGLRTDQAEFGLKLFGGDTVSTPGPLVLSVTMLGWVEAGGMVRRAGARPGDLVMVSGPIGDGYLGLKAARGELAGPYAEALAGRYRLPEPRLGVDLSQISACADISDGLVADAGHVARASGVAITLDLDLMPLSPGASAWLSEQPDRSAAIVALATGGDDYELVATGPAPIPGVTVIGKVEGGAGVTSIIGGSVVEISTTGWRHSKVI